ncbi:wax ester/triacylglycerol synthase family O-acyltransferase [Paucibacter sp. Y2R2-4]|uniref:wax ester/triacylglycerol synthase family O-acyltransferase n=1 Tax=Paucibacter sp. Y2R2-4 TaxID=2893553 RepID=UPI0021E41D66|nr:wax ester/triacylglycerol synthase family O-acyltransferase [Paucibacter sp. Y2R2-4]MCV2351703.1 wax ester/triacylglycerol synthase family O-acyltransferase [Paucibacter sp. Y2R2-4]
MNPLAGIDAAFLHLETAQMPMHVGALHLLELPADYAGDFLEHLRAHIAARLPLAPVLRRKLATMPLNLANPSWVEAEPDLQEHIVGYDLPPGSDMAALEQQVGLLHTELLDRERPLWKFHVFYGLEPGPEGEQRYGLYTQLHHAAVDGQAAVALAGILLDSTAKPRKPTTRVAAAAAADTASSAVAAAEIGTVGLLRSALAQQMAQTWQLARALPGAAGTLSSMAAQTAADLAGAKLKAWLSSEPQDKEASALSLAPRTRLNQSVSAERSFSTISLPLPVLHDVRRRHGASLNDALLFICAGALRRYFSKHGPLPRKSLVAAVPVSMRGSARMSKANTQATMSVVSLGTQVADPRKRLAYLLEASQTMKGELERIKSLMPSDYPSLGVPWLMQAGAQLYGRAHVAERLPTVANLVISNVPGPAQPLYLAGARVLSMYPASIVVHGLGLNITVQSYADSLDIGLMACAHALPETNELAAHLEAAFLEFLALPVAKPASGPASKKNTRKPLAKKAPASSTRARSKG